MAGDDTSGVGRGEHAVVRWQSDTVLRLQPESPQHVPVSGTVLEL